MPSISDAILANQARKAKIGDNILSTFGIDTSAPPAAPTPPQDQPLGLGSPQRGIFPANLVLASDRSDSSRVFRGAGMRSGTFPYPPQANQAATTLVQPGTTQIITPTTKISFADILGIIGYNQMPNSGVGPGTYTLATITVNAEGIVTAASSGSAGSVVNLAQAQINFTNPSSTDGQDSTAQVVFTGQSWVTASSIIVATIAAGTTDHPDADEPAVEGIWLAVNNIVVGTGFTVSAYCPALTWGHYYVNIIGL